MTTTVTLPDTDRLTLEAEFTINDAWWDEAQIIADALLAQEKPQLCSIKPWSTVATYMALNSDVDSALAKYLGTLRLHMRLAISAVLSCLLYTSPSPRDRQKSRMPSSA
jgi:uncharacterized protein YciW